MSLFPQAKKEKNSRGTILIVTLWILVILTVLALALGQRASLEVQLAQYGRDKLKANSLARAAIERAIWEKQNNDLTDEVDALSEPWANNEQAFKDFELGEGTFTVSYLQAGITLYGMQDETGSININTVDEQVLVNLLENCGIENAEELASSILIWSGAKPDTGEEETYYQSLDLPYHCKKENFKSVPELLLVRGMAPAILYGEDKDDDGQISEQERGIAQYLTVFGDGAVNINTASEKVLMALINDADLAAEIGKYRKGDDGEIGTEDDGLFSDSSFDLPEWAQLKPFQSLLSVSSDIYTIHAQAEVKRVKKSLSTTIDLTDQKQMSYLSWRTE